MSSPWPVQAWTASRQHPTSVACRLLEGSEGQSGSHGRCASNLASVLVLATLSEVAFETAWRSEGLGVLRSCKAEIEATEVVRSMTTTRMIT